MITQNNDYIMLIDDDYIKYRTSSSFNKVASKGSVVDDTFFYDTTNQVLTAQSSNTKPGGFSVYFANVSIGDVVEVECDIRSVSGDMPQLYFHECSTPDSNGTEANTTYRDMFQQGQWETMNETFIIKNITYQNSKIFIGLSTSKAGRYQMRNLKVRLKRNVFNRKQKVQREYCITKVSGSWVYDNYTTSDIPTLSTGTNSVIVTYDITFKKRPVALLTSNNSVSLPYKFIVNGDYSTTTITFYDNSNALVAESAIPNNTKFYLLVIGEL